MVDTCTLYYTPYEYNQKQDIGFYLHQEGPNLGKIPCPCYHRSKTPSLGPLLRDMPDLTPTLVLSFRVCRVIVTDRWDDQVILCKFYLLQNCCCRIVLFVCEQIESIIFQRQQFYPPSGSTSNPGYLAYAATWPRIACARTAHVAQWRRAGRQVPRSAATGRLSPSSFPFLFYFIC